MLTAPGSSRPGGYSRVTYMTQTDGRNNLLQVYVDAQEHSSPGEREHLSLQAVAVLCSPLTRVRTKAWCWILLRSHGS